MGFFQGLKEDLSQAVSELIPDEGESRSKQGTAFTAKQEEDLSEIEAMFRAKEEVKESQEEETVFNKQEEPYTYDTYERKYEAENLEVAPAEEVSKISAGMAINGDISAEGALELYGCVRGNISILGKMTVSGMIEGNSQAAEIYADGAKVIGEMRSDGAVKIGQETIITGNIFAASAVIAGAVKGDIDVQGPVVLDASAVVIGNIKCRSVQVNNGAVMEGMCSLCYADINPASFFEEVKQTEV